MTRYRTIVADPPWMYEDRTPPWRSTSAQTYGLMSVDAIKDLPVATLATPNAHLYLWAVLPMMAEAFDVVRAWGFRPSTVLTWCKPGVGLGGGFRGNTEHLIVDARRRPATSNASAARGSARPPQIAHVGLCDVSDWRHNGSVVPPVEEPRPVSESRERYTAPRGEHSAKPDLFADLIQRMSPGPYLEMFARRARFGWDYWGDQSLGTADLGEAA